MCLFKNVNEQSLKQLHEYVTSIQADRSYSLQPVDLVFFIRPTNTQSGMMTCSSLDSAYIYVHSIV